MRQSGCSVTAEARTDGSAASVAPVEDCQLTFLALLSRHCTCRAPQRSSGRRIRKHELRNLIRRFHTHGSLPRVVQEAIRAVSYAGVCHIPQLLWSDRCAQESNVELPLRRRLHIPSTSILFARVNACRRPHCARRVSRSLIHAFCTIETVVALLAKQSGQTRK